MILSANRSHFAGSCANENGLPFGAARFGNTGKGGTPTPVGWGGGAGVGVGAGHPALREVARGVSGKSSLTNLRGGRRRRFHFAHWRDGANIEAVTLEGP